MSRDGKTLVTASKGLYPDLESKNWSSMYIVSELPKSTSHQIKGISIHPVKQSFITLIHDLEKSYIYLLLINQYANMKARSAKYHSYSAIILNIKTQPT